MAHFPSTLAEFQRGESRLVYARYRSGEPGLFMLADGAAEEQRTYTRAELLCPVGGCPTPEFTTVDRSRSGRRDGFRHLVGNFNHAPESLFHLEAKAQLAQYIRARHPETVVVLEQPSNAERERVADVMVTWPDGRRVALEVQYSPLSADDWKIRHESYVSQRITDIWLFGHTGPQMNGIGLRVGFTPAQAEVARLGQPVLWFNPMTLSVATATADVVLSGAKRKILAIERRGDFAMEPLTEFRLDPIQFVSPSITEMAEAGVRYRQQRAEQEARKAQSRADAARKVAEERAWNAARRAAVLKVWLPSTSGLLAAERFSGHIPNWLNAHTGVDIPVPNQVWQWHLLTSYLDPIPDRDWVRRDHAWQALEAEFELGIDEAELRRS